MLQHARVSNDLIAVQRGHCKDGFARPISSYRLYRVQHRTSNGGRTVPGAAAAEIATSTNLEPWIEESHRSRKEWLQGHSSKVLQQAVENFQHPVFPCALIAGDVVILDLLSRLGYLKDGRVKVAFIDTFHLFEETHSFLHRLEEKYGFKAVEFHAKGFANKAEYRAEHGSDLFLKDIDEYDRICKVEPFNRALVDLEADVMINGRRQDHGFERAHIEVFEDGKPVKCNPLAYWTFKDCFTYLEDNKLEKHPLHDQGFPSVGDVHSTIPVPKEKWFEYAGERSGRFQGLTNKDGSAKTECGIHVAGEDEDTGLANIRG